MEHMSPTQEFTLPEIPDTKEDIQWYYHICEKCGTEIGELHKSENISCPKCAIEDGSMKVVKQCDVQMDYGKMQEIRDNAELAKLEAEIRHFDNDANESEERYCLQDCIETDDENMLDRIREECAGLGCNVCLSQTQEDIIEWPKHYNTGKIQPIDVIEDWKLDFRLANAVKYIARAGKKDPTKTKQDLEKALWYIRRFIDKECD